MKIKIKSILILSCIVFVSKYSQAQTQGSVFDNLSAEVQYGLNAALSPNEGLETSDYSGFNFFQLGLTYHIDNVWGVRGTFASSNFKHKDIDASGVKYNKLMLEATYNILTAANGMIQPFDITAHAGLGLTSGNSETLSGNDLAGVAQIGIMPKYYFNSQFSVFIDGTFVNQFSQDYGFDGLGMQQGSSGSYFNVGLGLQYKFKK